MDFITILAIGIGLFFAMNIGASGAAATMGVAYGSGAVPNKRLALCIVAVGVILGSFGGGEVIKTVGSGIIPSDILTVQLVIIILLAATLTLFGAILLGGRVLETNGKKITQMSLLQGVAISGTGGSLVVIASLFGIPVPLTQVTTTAIMGIGTSQHGFRLWQTGIIIKIVKVWAVSPLIALVVSYTLVKIFIEPELFSLIVLGALLIATLGIKSLYHTVMKERSAMNEDGSGI